MKEIPLSKFCERHSQSEAARLIGRTQGAVSQMLKAGRDVVIVDHGNGRFSAYERRALTPVQPAA